MLLALALALALFLAILMALPHLDCTVSLCPKLFPPLFLHPGGSRRSHKTDVPISESTFARASSPACEFVCVGGRERGRERGRAGSAAVLVAPGARAILGGYHNLWTKKLQGYFRTRKNSHCVAGAGKEGRKGVGGVGHTSAHVGVCVREKCMLAHKHTHSLSHIVSFTHSLIRSFSLPLFLFPPLLLPSLARSLAPSLPPS